MTTYAALLNGAAEHIRQGAAPLRTDHLLTADHAMAALAAFHAVLLCPPPRRREPCAGARPRVPEP